MCPLPAPEVPCRQFLYLQMVQASLPGVACRRDDGIETAEEWMPSGLTLNQRGSGDDRLISPFHYDSAGEVWGVSWSVHTISRRGPHGTWPPLSMEVTCSLTHFLSFSPFLSHFLHSLNPSRDHPPQTDDLYPENNASGDEGKHETKLYPMKLLFSMLSVNCLWQWFWKWNCMRFWAMTALLK